MTHGFKRIAQDGLLTEALEMMDINKITILTVVDKSEKVVGILSIHNIIYFHSLAH